MIRSYSLLSGALVFILFSSCIFAPLPFNEDKWIEVVENTQTEDLYANNRVDDIFFNPWLPQEDRSFSQFLRWRFSRTPHYSKEAQQTLPHVIPGLMSRIQDLPIETDFIAWIGHATFLIRLEGEYWITDPIFSDRALLPKRISPPAILAADLASLEGNLNVVLSHNHYDHLDKDSLQALPRGTRYYVPMGLKKFIKPFAAGPVREMNWWQTHTLPEGVSVTCLPAQHWSRRLLQGYNTTLWASYMIQKGNRTIYFGGDSGYFKGYKEIGKKFSSIDYALLPITAYEPRWFMHYPHMDTVEAIRAFKDLGAQYFVPTQWGTFHLGDNPPGLPAIELQQNMKDRNSDRYILLNIGEIRTL